MTERLPKSVLVGGIVLALLVLSYAAFSRPWYFTDQTYLGGIVLLEFLLVAVWLYRRFFFPIVIVAFLLAGVDLPVGLFWAEARWAFLAVGAFAGFVLMVRQRGRHFVLFHFVATFAVLMAVVSAAVSRYPSVALLKALSLFLLFLYAGTGARLAVSGRENRFFDGLVMGCEIFIGANSVLYLAGIEAMGNPNSLGAVTGVVCAPILLWGVLVESERAVVYRRWVFYTACMCLALVSHARAGMGAALLSSAVLCLGLRKYKLAFEGAIVVIIVFAATAIFRPQVFSDVTSTVVYKGADRQLGVLASRETPWNAAMDNIREHPWFGTGFGTTAQGENSTDDIREYKSTFSSTTENGSSYLAIASGVGALGAIPFGVLLVLIVGKIFQTLAWMRKTGSAAHPAIPLAMVMVAGIAHATFEDWMYAPGNYLCVFFWSVAFIFVDLAPKARVPSFRFPWRAKAGRVQLGEVAPVRSL